MASFKQILAQVAAKSDPTRKIVLGQIADIPNQQLAQETSLAAQKDQAYNDILGGARQRGLGFSGIPLGEQAKYNATQYAPAVANMKSTFNNQKTTLQQSLADVGRSDYMDAQNIFQADRSFREQQRQFNKQLEESRRQAAAARSAAASAGSGPSPMDYLSMLGGGGNNGVKASMSRRKDGGFNFSIAGKPVSAATYAKATQTQFRSLLSQMAKKGDRGAKSALSFVGNDFGYDPRKLNAQRASLYNALVWGSGKKATLPKSGGGGGW